MTVLSQRKPFHHGLGRGAELSTPGRLKINKKFRPFPAEDGDEFFPNGIFVFNITRMLAFIDVNRERFTLEQIEVGEIPYYGQEPEDKEAIKTADLARPILLAEISPGRYSLIDGHHRTARARRDGVSTLPAWRIRCPDHLAFLISLQAYTSYVEYWNGKVKELQRRR